MPFLTSLTFFSRKKKKKDFLIAFFYHRNHLFLFGFLDNVDAAFS